MKVIDFTRDKSDGIRKYGGMFVSCGESKSIFYSLMRSIWKRVNNQILGEFKFKFKSFKKNKYLYAE